MEGGAGWGPAPGKNKDMDQALVVALSLTFLKIQIGGEILTSLYI